MKLTFDIPDSLVPELKKIAVDTMPEGDIIEHPDGSRERIITPADEEQSLINYFRSLIAAGFKRELVDKELIQHQLDAQKTANDKLRSINVTTADG